MNVRLSARIGAFACLGAALAMGALALRDEPKPAPPSFTPSTDLPADPLQAQIRSCQLAGQAAGSDPGCLAAWAENRRRFFGQPPQAPAEPEPSAEPGKTTGPMIVPIEPAPQQEH